MTTETQQTCLAELHISDDHGDNYATMRCGLPHGHDGPHREVFHRSGTDVTVEWHVDDRGE
jgi:hypothetical protein